jgi:hypothetical protein
MFVFIVSALGFRSPKPTRHFCRTGGNFEKTMPVGGSVMPLEYFEIDGAVQSLSHYLGTT